MGPPRLPGEELAHGASQRALHPEPRLRPRRAAPRQHGQGDVAEGGGAHPLRLGRLGAGGELAGHVDTEQPAD